MAINGPHGYVRIYHFYYLRYGTTSTVGRYLICTYDENSCLQGEFIFIMDGVRNDTCVRMSIKTKTIEMEVYFVV